MKALIPLPLAAALFATTLSASAVSLSFTRMTTNSPTDVAEDLSLEVVSGGTTSAVFTFSKGILHPGTITQIYIEDGPSLFSAFEFTAVLSSPEVSYAAPATPPGPPGISPFSSSYSVAPNSPQPTNGISAGEVGVFTATLSGGITFADVESAIANDTLRVALHAQGLPGGQSDSFLAVGEDGGGDPPLPEPGVPLLGGLAMLLLHLRRRRN